jgi:predicted amino acid-binding ACT domain protein
MSPAGGPHDKIGIVLFLQTATANKNVNLEQVVQNLHRLEEFNTRHASILQRVHDIQ